MAIRFSCSACGKRLKVDDRYAGRTSKCPGCGQSLTVPPEGTWEEDDSTPEADIPAPVVPPPVPVPHLAPAVPSSLIAIRTNEEDEPRPWKPSKPAPARASSRRRVALIGTLAGLPLVVFAIVLSLWIANASRPRQSPQPVVAVERAKPITAPPPDDAPSAEKEREPIPPEDMPRMAQLWVTLYIEDTVKGFPRAEKVLVNDVEVRAVHDERKIDWLWNATATVTVLQRSEVPNQLPTSFPMTWRIRFQFTPDYQTKECWREVLEMKFGQSYRKHFGRSEWSLPFRRIVTSTWNRRFRDWDEQMRARNETAETRPRYLDDLRRNVMAELKISVEELQEIIEATD